MESIYSIIQENPDYFAWVFGLVNALWGIFLYFNKQSHDKALENLKHGLSLEAERRKKVFELKVSQYEAYVSNLDEFGKKHQVDLPAKMQPIFDKYFNDYLAAAQVGDKDKEREVLCWFGTQVSEVMRDSTEDLMKLQAESNKLKLTATDQMVETFARLEALTKASSDKSNEFMSKFLEIVLSQNNELSAKLQEELASLGKETQAVAKELMEQMRQELQTI
ncbi:hypothetical protein O2V57_004488 [Vibrio parahaemolyticus]|uniref:hypothetical protein n=1 Tax=Vibrio TaxID=662 RepID=UPI0005F03A59|nr:MULTISPECIES: hypothetical protein [Vibrio harveyi group]EJP4178050.1 hypothetical protein [Vibrio vulnificus]EID4382760.1 hypothetical protein [Vibrio parahaemolyticus]EKG2657586.1 hypothetical protein [Vibrio parahaemolyticus]MCX8875381.1 hypothetical protein [Vibrio parahaemolyticus]OUJ22005.1 hypothetical protein BTO19_25210 [Vibrio parahaemolyticus]